MANKKDILKHYLGEIDKLIKEINLRKEQNYVYTNIMETYIARYNQILSKYHKSTGIPLERFKLEKFDLSSTGKTVRQEAIERYLINLSSTNELIEEKLYNLEQENISPISPHQMRKCFKTGVDGCPKNPQLKNNKVFIGMPFDDGYLDSYTFGILPALNSFGLNHFRADAEISTTDIMCKICEQMQICKYLIFNISGLNPNVMLELGLSYGLGKETIIIKDTETKMISDLGSNEYIEYSHAIDLRDKLVKYFNK